MLDRVLEDVQHQAAQQILVAPKGDLRDLGRLNRDAALGLLAQSFGQDVGGVGFVFDEQHPHQGQPTPFGIHALFMIHA